MDIVILAGGRGKRLGALTHARQKGAISFAGIPLIVRVVDQWLAVPGNHRIHVVTGYRGADIKKVLDMRYPGLLQERIVLIQGDAVVTGTLRRLVYAFPHLQDGTGLIVDGIDVLQTQATLLNFVVFARKNGSSPVVDLSPDIGRARTHPLVRLRKGLVVEYLPGSEQEELNLHGKWHRHVSLRYFPAHMYARLEEASKRVMNLSMFFAGLVGESYPVRGCVSRDPWVHVSTARDFRLKVPE